MDGTIVIESPDATRERENQYMGIEKAFTSADPEERQRYLGAVPSSLNVQAHFYDDQGHKLLPDEMPGYSVSGTLEARMDLHMPHFKLSVAEAEPSSHLIAPDYGSEAKVAVQTITEQVMLETRRPGFGILLPSNDATENSNEIKEAAESANESIDKIEYFKGDEDLENVTKYSAYIEINYASFIELKSIDLRLSEQLSNEHKTYVEKEIPVGFRRVISEHRQKMAYPFLIEISFDPSAAVLHRIYTGTPRWATLWAEHMQRENVIPEQPEAKVAIARMIVEGDGATASIVANLRRLLLLQKQAYFGPLSEFLNAGHRDWFNPDHLLTMPIQGYELHYKYQPRVNFFEKDQYLTVLGVPIPSSQRKADSDAALFCEQEHDLKMVKIPGANDRAYFGFFSMPPGSNFRITKGTRIEIYFKSQWGVKNPEVWTGYIASENVTSGPQEFMAMTVHRPWYKGKEPSSGSFSRLEIGESSTDSKFISKAASRIRKHSNNRVKLKFVPDTKMTKSLLSAIKTMSDEAVGGRQLPWNDTMDLAILGNRLDTLVVKDLYQPVRTSVADVEKCMDLNGQQLDIIRAARVCPGGLLVVQGPPGTGKSYLMIQMARPYWQLRQIVLPLLAVAPTNIAVDTLTRKYHTALSEDIRVKKSVAGRYVVRVHSANTEISILKREIFKDQTSKLDAHPNVLEEVLGFDELDEDLRLLHHEFKAETDRKFAGIDDPRVTLPEHSVAMMMLEVSGYIQGPRTADDADSSSDFAEFCSQVRELVENGQIDEKRFRKCYRQVWNYTLEHASVIIATTAQGGFRQVLDTIKTSVRIIFVDEAAYTREDLLLPFFAARLMNCLGLVLLGDPLQLKPHVMMDDKSQLFAKQMKLAFMTRLIANGHPSYMLTDQHRMIPQILAIANKLTYNGRLIAADDTRVKNRPIAQAFRDWVSGSYDQETNTILVNVPPCQANITDVNSSKTRWNDLFVILEIKMLCQLLGVYMGASIAILTGYQAQKRKLVAAVSRLAVQGVVGVDRVAVHTFDASIGEDWDFVIMDVLTEEDSRSLGFQKDPHRMNVALTRARNGLVIFADVDGVKGCYSDHLKYIGGLLQLLRDNQVQEEQYGNLPAR